MAYYVLYFKVLNITCKCYDKPTILQVVGLIRNVKPSIVFTHSPTDYMVDHEITSKLVRTACFSAGMPNISTLDSEPFNFIPYLYYYV